MDEEAPKSSGLIRVPETRQLWNVKALKSSRWAPRTQPTQLSKDDAENPYSSEVTIWIPRHPEEVSNISDDFPNPEAFDFPKVTEEARWRLEPWRQPEEVARTAGDAPNTDDIPKRYRMPTDDVLNPEGAGTLTKRMGFCSTAIYLRLMVSCDLIFKKVEVIFAVYQSPCLAMYLIVEISILPCSLLENILIFKIIVDMNWDVPLSRDAFMWIWDDSDYVTFTFWRYRYHVAQLLRDTTLRYVDDVMDLLSILTRMLDGQSLEISPNKWHSLCTPPVFRKTTPKDLKNKERK